MNKIQLVGLTMIIGLSSQVIQAKDSKDQYPYGISITYTTAAGQKLSTTDDAQKKQLAELAVEPTSKGFCLRGLAEAISDVKNKNRKKQTEDIELVISEETLRRGTNDENRYTLPGIAIHLENHFADKDLLDQNKIAEFIKPTQLASQSLSLDKMKSKCEDIANDFLDRAFHFRENADKVEAEERKEIEKIKKQFSAVR